jgi:hypothetical protein
MRENASPGDPPEEAPPDRKVHISLGIVSIPGRPTRKTDCEVQGVCYVEGTCLRVNHGPKDLGTMTTTAACGSHARQTMEENEQK